MVNTRRGKYQVHLTPIGSEDDSSITNMHNVRMRRNRFKTTPYMRPYRLPSERNHSNLSNMDSDERDDVPLIYILKRGVFGKNPQPDSSVPGTSTVVPSPSENLENLSQDLVNIDQGSNSSHVKPESVPTSENPTSEHSIEVQEPNKGNEASRDILDPVSDVGEDRPQKKSRKASTRPKVITTKTGHRKVPPNIPSIPIDGISFHLEESVHRWKYVVQRRFADEVNISDKHHSCLSVMDLEIQAGLSKTIFNVGQFYP
ncbi:cell wall protein RBR3-like [Cucumis melo var. makuwa]|uniref:Cell wall protein RBR3-like n=1 Tax=Cucumis melo var. makuwa TaxID=1194695 RepID=A0A5D3DU39_CUCMM|nr:cell wall protein RBR3-like [Cucumis melo var. makuwa]